MTIKSPHALLIIFLLIVFDASSQNPVVIKGKFKPKIENTSVLVYKPIAGNFNMVYPEAKSETTIDSEFKFNLNIDKPGFVRLESKAMPKTYFYAEPGNSIQIVFVKDATGNMTTSYSGSNAEANNLLAHSRPMNNQNFLQTSLPEILQKETAQAVFDLLAEEINMSTLPLKEMLKKGKISQTCFDAMMQETEQTMIHWVNTYLKNYFITDEDLSQVSKLNRDEMKKLAQKLYDSYDPYNNNYLETTRTYNNSLIKSILIENKFIKSERSKIELWSPYEKEFSMIVSHLPAIDYAPDYVQMYFMGNSLISASVFKPMTHEQFLKIFNAYYAKFPDSPYNSIILNYLSEQSNGSENVNIKPESEIHFLQDENTSDLENIKSIQSLIKKHFQGKAVFVDFWATWCSPCIAEFQYEPILNEFLEREKIAMLYVSIDNMKAEGNWKKLINRYQLKGFHYLATEEVRASLDKWFMGIPRYMLFDSSGQLKNDNLPKPSTKQELFGEITQLLKK
jgi:thiol-disulfide isomerase/thioredoxin